MNLPGIVTLWLASGLALAYAAWRFGSDAIKQVARGRFYCSRPGDVTA